MYFNLISKYRTQLMGLAILWVMFYHSPLSLISYPILNQIKSMGYGGVDIFMFVSGFGIYNSLSGNPSIKDFYIRRILRIIPYYTPVVLAFGIVAYMHGKMDLIAIILDVSTLSYWFNSGHYAEWYIPVILVFYLLSPLLFKIFVRQRLIALVVPLALCLFLFYMLGGSKYTYLLLAVGRFPLYLLGFWLGGYMNNNKEFKYSKLQILLFAFLLIFGIFLWNYLFSHYWGTYWSDNQYGLLFIPFWVMTFPLCLFISYMLSLLKDYKYPALKFFGANSLIFYIFHMKIITILYSYQVPYVTFVALLLTITVGILWKKIVDLILNRFVQIKK